MTNVALIAFVQTECGNAGIEGDFAHLGGDEFPRGIVDRDEAEGFPPGDAQADIIDSA